MDGHSTPRSAAGNVLQGAAAAQRATEGVTVNSDIHADATYRAALATVLVRRALELARSRSS